ncbi:MAG TPA: pyridoxamine 5'-phosphate oxidase family protein [Candidatus Paceibacterota bacterium]|nr:pyridoxamine 5'-phosphate oxidase family protein [Candidatus Paceibacterota bacterium]
MGERHDKRAREILSKIRYATVATVTSDGKSWSSPIAPVIDTDFNIYWFCDKDSQHARNIHTNPRIVVVVHDLADPGSERDRVYMEADVIELTDPTEIQRVRNANRMGSPPDLEEFAGHAVRKCYKSIPRKVWMNDPEGGSGAHGYRIDIHL